MFRVTTLDMENPPRTEEGGIDWSQDFFGQAGLAHRLGPAQCRELRHGLWRRVHLRPHLPCRELQHHAACGGVLDDRARDRLCRPRGRHEPRRGHAQVRDPRRAGGLLRRAGHAQPFCGQGAPGAPGARGELGLCARDLHRGHRDPGGGRGQGAEVRLPRELGHRPADRARALPHRAAL